MARETSHSRFSVNLTLYVLGPEQPRRKYKPNKATYAETQIILPFVPYPGMYLRMETPAQRSRSRLLHFRVRTVEWSLDMETFECMVDEVSLDPCFAETHEARGSPNSEERFAEIERLLETFGFKLTKNMDLMNRLLHNADGRWIDPEEEENEKLALKRYRAEFMRWAQSHNSPSEARARLQSSKRRSNG